MLIQLEHLGVVIGRLTLHVGAGTFQPVRTESIDDHRMHCERFVVSDTLAQQVRETRARGGRVVAVGTTVVRALESAAVDNGLVRPRAGDTDIFILPGFRFQVVDAMLTNFHLPESTLLMLVSAFTGKGNVMRAYQHAVDNRYRFFSYGDACFIEKGASIAP